MGGEFVSIDAPILVLIMIIGLIVGHGRRGRGGQPPRGPFPE